MKRVLVIVVAALVLLLQTNIALASVRVNTSGQVSVLSNPQVLSSDSGDEESESDSDRDGEENDDEEENELPTGVRVRTREESEEGKVEIYDGAAKLRIESRAGRTRVRIENDDDEQMEIDDDEVEVEQEDGTSIKIATAEGELEISGNKIRTRTNFPLSIDLATNSLYVTTPNGEVKIKVLPAVAIQNMLRAGFATRTQTVASSSGELETQVELTQEDGELVYSVEAVSEQKLFGFINLPISRKIKVSSQTGEVVSVEENPLFKLLDLLSI